MRKMTQFVMSAEGILMRSTSRFLIDQMYFNSDVL